MGKMFNPIVGLARKIAGIPKAAYKGATAWHFEDRHAANGKHPTYSEVLAKGSGWRKLSAGESIYHSNGMGFHEQKFVHDATGREAVFTRDKVFGGSSDGSYQPYTDPKYMATFNYVTTAPKPTGITDVKGAARWAATGAGHVLLDVVPYKLGAGNVRGPN